jgi:hypothetical protein
MDQDPSWEANGHWASLETPNFLWNLTVHILSKMYPVHTFTPYFVKIHSNIIHA